MGSGSDGVLRFKKTFNKGGQGRFYVGRRVFLGEEFRRLCSLCSLAGDEVRAGADGFFPAYRLPADERQHARHGYQESR